MKPLDPHAYLSSLQPLAMRFGLERMERALDALGHPERGYRVLHVGGTNGKGSTCAMAAAALREAGLRTGLYTSPHLVRFNERIQVDGVEISDAALAATLEAVRRACPWHEAGGEGDRLTYFEVATLAGLLHLAAERVDAAVIEVGLGGRFDATNAIRPAVTAIARIGLDHTQLLGDTVERVAFEKAGIFKPGVPAVVHAAQPAGALEVLRAEAARRGAPFVVAGEAWDGPVALRGPHQRANAALAAAALRALAGAGVAVPEDAIARGIAGARWPGRLEELGGVLLDGAHNPQGAAALAAALPALHPGRPVELVFGVLADKDHAGMLAALAPAVRRLHLVTPPSPRARPAAELRALAEAHGVAADVHGGLAEAIACARAAAGEGGVVGVAGSLYLVGEARALLGAPVPG
ncbi:folylpolyglutamate synthase/dihydrofolate synthase family protein [Anaeromyxobacter sp. PSR-1]|uniref:bifunctional folylpolyglutamate synthase/dihydrofolate synthase n=1 Tax=unclassified Anaeromyxobacter TaxID=2620896 RepID=UPI0005E721E9|nr:folylpolyglutamate synthase/dihydrofolate synthase family protein [Anaeromyxobacter sp. PSR-1]GAO05073.1 folylpolyglutamate synthase [Anaeromyxobacter sp. PSR-1]